MNISGGFFNSFPCKNNIYYELLKRDKNVFSPKNHQIAPKRLKCVGFKVIFYHFEKGFF